MLTKYNFETKAEVLLKLKEFGNKTVLIFGSKMCQPCTILSQYLDSYKTDKEINIIELKIPEFKDLPYFKEKFQLKSFPTSVVVDASEKEFDRMVGYSSGEAYANFLNKNF